MVKCAGILANLWHPCLALYYTAVCQTGRQHQVGRVVWLGMHSARPSPGRAPGSCGEGCASLRLSDAPEISSHLPRLQICPRIQAGIWQACSHTWLISTLYLADPWWLFAKLIWSTKNLTICFNLQFGKRGHFKFNWDGTVEGGQRALPNYLANAISCDHCPNPMVFSELMKAFVKNTQSSLSLSVISGKTFNSWFHSNTCLC